MPVSIKCMSSLQKQSASGPPLAALWRVGSPRGQLELEPGFGPEGVRSQDCWSTVKRRGLKNQNKLALLFIEVALSSRQVLFGSPHRHAVEHIVHRRVLQARADDAWACQCLIEHGLHEDGGPIASAWGVAVRCLERRTLQSLFDFVPSYTVRGSACPRIANPVNEACEAGFHFGVAGRLRSSSAYVNFAPQHWTSSSSGAVRAVSTPRKQGWIFRDARGCRACCQEKGYA